jgi:6-pyruvoyltetrahydropterin/6-carboxytetrahydropterin synthase
MYTIAKDFRFEAAHHLPLLPEDHKCKRPHGHSYVVSVRVSTGTLNREGFVVDFAALDPFKEYLRTTFDHRDINTVVTVSPTSENLAARFFYWCQANLNLPVGVQVTSVQVAETDTSSAEYNLY